MPVTYETWLVLLSIVMATQGAYVGLSLAVQIGEATGARRRLLLAGAVEEVHREIESAIAASAAVRETSDFREGVTAFLEKREPRWTGH